jgi:hypothetical protein
MAGPILCSPRQLLAPLHVHAEKAILATIVKVWALVVALLVWPGERCARRRGKIRDGSG